MLIYRLHRCFEQASYKARHVKYGRVNEELLDDVLIGENLAEPE